MDLNLQMRVAPFIKLAALSFPSCFQDKASFHQSWLQNSLLHKTLTEGASLQGIDFLVNGLKLNAGVRDSKTQQNALHYALRQKHPQEVLTLLLHSLPPKEQTNILNGADHQGLTPLDEAMEHDESHSFVALSNLGATSCSASIALKFYKRKVRLDPTLHKAFRGLMSLNPEVEWVVSLEELLPPLISKKSYTGTILTSSTYGDRQLPDNIKNQIVDEAGNFILYSSQGNHPVAYAHKRGPLKRHGLYFKAYPALPGLEEAAGGLTRQLLGFGAPHTDLVKLGDFPCLISQEIPGDTLLKTLKTDPSKLSNLDEEDISGMLIAAMLTNPEDGKPDNYIVTSHPTKPKIYRIVGIDNDQVFVPAIVKETPDKTFFRGQILPIAQVKTILYCLDQMKSPIHSSVRARIINIHPDRFLENCLLSSAFASLSNRVKGQNKITKTEQMLYKACLLKIWKFTAFAASAVLLGAIFLNPILAMTGESEKADENSNIMEALPFDAWVQISSKLIYKKDVNNLARVCKFAHAVIGTDGAWEGVAKIYLASPAQVKNPLFFIARAANKVIKGSKNTQRISHIGELLPDETKRGLHFKTRRLRSMGRKFDDL